MKWPNCDDISSVKKKSLWPILILSSAHLNSFFTLNRGEAGTTEATISIYKEHFLAQTNLLRISPGEVRGGSGFRSDNALFSNRHPRSPRGPDGPDWGGAMTRGVNTPAIASWSGTPQIGHTSRWINAHICKAMVSVVGQLSQGCRVQSTECSKTGEKKPPSSMIIVFCHHWNMTQKEQMQHQGGIDCSKRGKRGFMALPKATRIHNTRWIYKARMLAICTLKSAICNFSMCAISWL